MASIFSRLSCSSAVLGAAQDAALLREAQALGAVAALGKERAPRVLAQLVVALLRSGEAGLGAAGFPLPGRDAARDRIAELGARHLEILELLLFGCALLAYITKDGYGTKHLAC